MTRRQMVELRVFGDGLDYWSMVAFSLPVHASRIRGTGDRMATLGLNLAVAGALQHERDRP